MLLIVLLHMVHTVTYVTFSVRIVIPDNLWSRREPIHLKVLHYKQRSCLSFLDLKTSSIKQLKVKMNCPDLDLGIWTINFVTQK